MLCFCLYCKLASYPAPKKVRQKHVLLTEQPTSLIPVGSVVPSGQWAVSSSDLCSSRPNPVTLWSSSPLPVKTLWKPQQKQWKPSSLLPWDAAWGRASTPTSACEQELNAELGACCHSTASLILPSKENLSRKNLPSVCHQPIRAIYKDSLNK